MRASRLALAAIIAAAAAASYAAPPNVKNIVIDCEPGWRGTAVGQYGGVGFEVSCNNGRGHERLTGWSGTAYSFRMGVEGAVGADCVYADDAPTVDVTCVAVRFTVR